MVRAAEHRVDARRQPRQLARRSLLRTGSDGPGTRSRDVQVLAASTGRGHPVVPRRRDQGYYSGRDRNPIVRVARWLAPFLLLAFVTHSLVTTLLAMPIVAASVASQPTVRPTDRLLVAPIVYGPRLPTLGIRLPGLRLPDRGDLVLVRPAFVSHPGFVVRAIDPVVRFVTLGRVSPAQRGRGRTGHQIKRVIGVPGDTVRVERFVAYIRPREAIAFFIEYDLARRPYSLSTDPRPAAWLGTDPFGDAAREVTLGDGEYFLLSDDRSIGIDSRHWGPIGLDDIVGKVWLRYQPFRDFGRL
ncbi:MAG: signal peptidase I [Spirochaetaceae bacterium]|nr:MAG: signal peptidase I [Spirochaetaceae bacterium]